jgi:hypothetical protein
VLAAAALRDARRASSTRQRAAASSDGVLHSFLAVYKVPLWVDSVLVPVCGQGGFHQRAKGLRQVMMVLCITTKR